MGKKRKRDDVIITNSQFLVWRDLLPEHKAEIIANFWHTLQGTKSKKPFTQILIRLSPSISEY